MRLLQECPASEDACYTLLSVKVRLADLNHAPFSHPFALPDLSVPLFIGVIGVDFTPACALSCNGLS